jgi:murein DD-endopeptidase MepM/ murein hydrolase activator NlpD
MNLILFSRRKGTARHINLSHPLSFGLLGLLVVGILAGVFAAGLRTGQLHPAWSVNATAVISSQQSNEIAKLKAALQDKIDALSLRLGQLNAHLIRLNALGKRLTEMANISSSEFDFDHDPPQGGPESGAAVHTADLGDLGSEVDAFDVSIDRRTAQFSALQDVLTGRQLSDEIRPSGRPVREGYISSFFGERADPFDGEEEFHKGLDFAGQLGDDVLAVAAGLVTWAGPREGYGNLVEINHGNGLVTRYAHDSKVFVAVGDTVQRGQTVAALGTTGHSTGPHVHFEVLKDGHQVNPAPYVAH